MQARSIKNQLNRKTTQSSTAPKIFMALAMFMEQAKATAKHVADRYNVNACQVLLHA
jgi:hypothetical protein